ncbi:MAG: phosphonate metabolism transcriptional regulator PhnF [Pseudomonadota bacterium]|nr:phosphonate metabolism transcriptional regulator PhnF [Pseudomonadota bacterium]
MTRTTVWGAIAETLRGEIAAAQYRPGDRLPTEAALSQRFGVNRHTVRRALADLAEAGLVRARRGAGVFVTRQVTDYPIGRRVRFHRNMAAAGQLPRKRILHLAQRPATAAEAEALHLEPGAEVIACEGISAAEATPLALFHSSFPAARVPGLVDTLREISSVTEALAPHCVPDLQRRHTRVDAEVASAAQAVLLELRAGDLLLRTTGVNIEPNGVPIEYGVTWFAAERVTLTFAPD